MALQYDESGFLTGNTVTDIRRSRDTLSQISIDVAAIKRAVTGSRNVNSGRHRNAPAVPSNSNVRSINDRPSAVVRQIAEPQIRSSVSEPPSLARDVRRQTAVAEPVRQRAANGRFVGNGNVQQNTPNAPNQNDNPENKKTESAIISNAADKIAGAVRESANGLEDVDPTVRAFKEVAEPLSRGYNLLFGGEKDKNNNKWFRRIFGELRLFRRDESVFNRVANRSLHNIESRTDDDNDSGQSFLGGLLGSISPWVMGALATVGTTLLAGVTTVLGVIFSPIGLAIGAVATAAWGLFTEDGRKFFANIGSKLVDGWFATLDYLTPIFDSIGAKWSEGVKVFTDLWEPIAKFFSDKFGIVTKTVSDVVSKTNKFINEKTGVDVVGSIKKGYAAGSKAITSAKDWVLGQTSKFFESGRGGAGTVSSGKGDYGGASYGTYQLSSKAGTLQKFLKSTPFGNQFEGLKPGTSEFNKKWKSVAKSEPDFEAAQHDFIKKTHFDPQNDKLLQSGIDLSGRGAAVQDALWSTAVQFGGDTSLILNAFKGRDVSKMSDAEIVSAIQDYKIANNDRLFSSSSENVRAGTLNRHVSEKDQLLKLVSLSAKTQSMSPPIPVAPSMPKPQMVADAPTITMPLGSGDSRKSMSVKVDKGLVGQDVSDRGIALIITGGLSGKT